MDINDSTEVKMKGFKHKCPKCNSKNYDRCITVDLRIRHKNGSVSRQLEHDGVYPWWFECLECGHREQEE